MSTSKPQDARAESIGRTSQPVVSVIIPTYNWSSVLYYSIQSVLRQTFANWELFVVGDGCTDDSETIVHSFGDPRIRWYNLSTNTGSQAAPNNKGVDLSTGEFIAYLGHDDLWHPTHLQVLLDALQSNKAELGYTITKLIQPRSKLRVALCGLSASGQYEPVMIVPPSSVMHRRRLIGDIGGWRTYDTSQVPIDLELVVRTFAHQKRIIHVEELTVFKFPSAARPNAYREKKSDEQREYALRMMAEPEFRYRELMGVVTDKTHIARAFTLKRNVEFMNYYTEKLNRSRIDRGLNPLQIFSKPIAFHEDLSSLIATNVKDDIAPLHDRQHLHEHGSLPSNGLLIGANWYAHERDEWGRSFRWANTDAQILVTRPRHEIQRLVIHAAPGPGNDYQSFVLQLCDEFNHIIGEGRVEGETHLEFEVPIRQAEMVMYRLQSDATGKAFTDSDRIMNFAVYGFWWKSSEVDAVRTENLSLKDLLKNLEAENEVLQERSLLYHVKAQLRRFVKSNRSRLLTGAAALWSYAKTLSNAKSCLARRWPRSTAAKRVLGKWRNQGLPVKPAK